jgi:D-alanine-D-alanine ligase
MKVALLHNLNRGEHEYEADFDLPVTIDALTAALNKQHEVVPVECTRDFIRWLVKLALEKPDIIFNVAEGFKGAARESVYAAIYEQLGLDYCGPGPTELLITHNKSLTKKLLTEKGIPMAWSKLLSSPKDLESLKGLVIVFPLIVKLNSEGSSMGMDENCIVKDWDQMEKQVTAVWEKFHTNILVEQYIEGSDVSMTYIEGLGEMGPVQYIYPDHTIYDFRLKTKDNHTVDITTPFTESPEIIRTLRDLTHQVASTLDLNGYGRADFRVTPDGSIYFLEMNAQVCFHPQGAFVLGAQKDGHSYEDVVLHIVRHAKEHPRKTSAIGK